MRNREYFVDSYPVHHKRIVSRAIRLFYHVKQLFIIRFLGEELQCLSDGCNNPIVNIVPNRFISDYESFSGYEE